MLKSIPPFLNELLEQERRADEALACVHRVMEMVERIGPDYPFDEDIFFDTEVTEDREECLVCIYNTRKYVTCFHCSRTMCVMCGARSPWEKQGSDVL